MNWTIIFLISCTFVTTWAYHCRQSSSCKGTCRYTCSTNEHECPYSKCSTYGCKCCKPNTRVACTSPYSRCGKNGRCKQKCDFNEKECPVSKCHGLDCKCCKPESAVVECEDKDPICARYMDKCKDDPWVMQICQKTCGSCNEDTICTNPYSKCGINGRCKEKCNDNERECPVSKCNGADCKCCKPGTRNPPYCTNSNSKCGKNGHCKVKCDFNENECPVSKCDGVDCKCCKPDNAICTYPYSKCGKNGRCKEQCNSIEKECPVSKCDGADCKCCKPAPTRRSCLRLGSPCGDLGNGVCRLDCRYNEKVCKVSHCDGADCKCCKPKSAVVECEDKDPIICARYMDNCKDDPWVMQICQKTCGSCNEGRSYE